MMNRLIFLILLCLLSVKLAAQIKKGQFVAALSGQFQQDNTDGITPIVGGFTYNFGNEMRATSYQLTPAILYALKSRLLVGGGLDFKHADTKINPQDKTVSGNSGAIFTVLLVKGRSAENIIAPFLYAEYLFPLGNKFVLSAASSASYGFLNNKSSIEHYSRNPSTGEVITAQTYERTYRSSGYTLALSPVLRYQMFPHFGLQLTCGGFYLNQKLEDFRLPDYQPVKPSLGLDFAPKTWQLGVFINH